MTTAYSLDEITIDLVRKTARVGAGVTWRELLAATSGLGLTGLAGSNGNSTVVADTLGGGLSWFGRAFGPVGDNLLDIDVLDPQGGVRRVGAASDPGLFRSIRAGSADAAVVAVEVELYPVPLLSGGRMLWPIDSAEPVLEAFAGVTASAPDELTVWAELLRFPNLPHVPRAMRGNAFIAVDIVFLGSAGDADRKLAAFRDVPGSVLDTVGPMALRDLPTVSGELFQPFPSIDFCRFLTRLDGDAIRSLLAAVGPGFGSSLLVVQLRHLGGALQPPPGGRGPTGAIPEPYQLFCTGIPFTPEIAADIELDLAILTVALDACLSERTVLRHGE